MEETGAPTGESGAEAVNDVRKHRKRPPLPIWAIAVVSILVAAGVYGGYVYYLSTQKKCGDSHTIVIDAYDSFMGSGSDPSASRGAVFSAFGNATGSCVTVNYLTTDVANLISSSQSTPSQLPDIAIGLTEVTAEELGIQGMLVPYAPSGLSDVSPSVVSGISPEHYATPYEWQFLGTDFLTDFNNQSEHVLTTGDLFQPLASNATLARNFLYENPTTDPVGKEFLLWEYQFYTSVLHQNWTTFWKSAKPYLPAATPSWGDGISEFNTTGYPMFLSFGTDPAYFATYPSGFSMNTSFSLYNGTDYGWKTIYGAAIVKGGVHDLALDKQFINWLLSENVQSLIPLNEWMYPANNTIGLPAVYSANPPVANLVALNSFTTPRATAQNITSLLLQWTNIMG